jgi:hypothetical protein|uniref:Nucleotide-diphospho-sugar transferase domain-containing protein n=1 Tax=viral metagenome TaxID=1070528 RepID=A0A6C0JTH0_9ZZZZ
MDSTANKEEKEKKIVALAFQGEQFSSKFLLCWTNTLSVLWQSGNYEFLIACGDNNSLIHSRMRTLGLNNEIHKPFNENKFDYWITIDKNMLFTPQQILDLITSLDEHDIVSGLYKCDDTVNYNAIQNIDNAYFKTNGSYQYLLQEDIDKWKEDMKTKYLPVDYVALSFFGTKASVINSLEFPFFDGENIVIDKDDGKKYNIVPSEDFNLCKKLKDKNYQIMVNLDIRVGNSVNLII